MWALTILALLFSIAPRTWALTEFEYLNVAHNFVQQFIAPQNELQVQAVNSSLFSDDVKGTVDVTTNFDGRELTTEYLFGLFVELAKDPKNPSPIPKPIGYNITKAVVQHNTVAASMKFDSYYAVLDQVWPIEIEGWFNINEQHQITEYDFTFRRWQWATDVIVPLLIPHMKTYINTTSTNATYILQQYLAQATCAGAQQYCQGSNLQYDSHSACMEFLTSIDIGEFTRLGEDNLGCRWLHTAMLQFRPEVHCPHVGPSGGDMCIARDYREVVLESHFPQGFLAPKYVTPENQRLVQPLYSTTNESLSPLMEISMSQLDEHSWDPSFFATGTFFLFLILYVSSRITFQLFNRFNRHFSTLSPTVQKNVVAYVITIIFTSLALALELTAAPTFAGEYRLWAVKSARCAVTVTAALYCWELTYRDDMRLPLIIHHVLTVFAVAFTITIFEKTQSPTYMVSGLIWLFQATTEQPTFVGLLGYRLKWDPRLTSRILKFAAIQTFVLKTASALALIVYWGIRQNYTYRSIDIAWSAMVWIIAIGLMLTQVWGSWITYQIGVRVVTKRPTFGLPSLPSYSDPKIALEDSQEAPRKSHRLSQPRRTHARGPSAERLLYPPSSMSRPQTPSAASSRSPSPDPPSVRTLLPSPTSLATSYFLPRRDPVYHDEDDTMPQIELRETPEFSFEWNNARSRQ